MGLLDALAGASQGVASGLQGWNAATYKNAELDERRRHQQVQEDLTRQQREVQQQDFNWRKSEADSKRMLDSQRTLATMWYLNGGPDVDPTGSKFTKERGFNPFEHVSPDIVSRVQDRAEQRDLQRQLAQDRNDTMRAIASMRMDSRGGGEDSYKFLPMVMPDGSTKVVAVNPKDPTASPIEVGGAPSKGGGLQAQPGMLPLDTGARKALAEWNTSVADASRVEQELDAAMGAKVDPATGQKIYQQQPSGPLSGGTGLLLGALPDKYAARLDPEGTHVRSAIANFSSQIMNQLSGAAVSEAEKKRLEAFLPTSSDTWDTLRTKMGGYKNFLRSKGEGWRTSYGEHEALQRGMNVLGGNTPQSNQQVTRPPLSSFGGQ